MIETGLLVRHDIVTRDLTVSTTMSLSPSFVRVTLTGDELDGFTSLGPADHVKVIFSDGVRRDFTPRAFRAAGASSAPELDLDFFLHGDGSASNWVRTAAIGDMLTVAGPRGSHLPPTMATRVILGADESALPAFARWIEMLPEEVEIFGFVELDNASDAAYLSPDHVHRARVVWLDKSHRALERGIRSLGHLGDDTFVWAAGEATGLIPIRRYLKFELGLPKQQMKVDGYWKQGIADHDHHAPIDPDDPED